MIQTEYGYKFESTGHEFSTHGSGGLSITDDGILRYGYDGIVDMANYDEDELFYELSEEEKKELAIYMIEKWALFGNIPKEQFKIA